jgi:hypothetical protein
MAVFSWATVWELRLLFAVSQPKNAPTASKAAVAKRELLDIVLSFNDAGKKIEWLFSSRELATGVLRLRTDDK